MTSQSFHEYVAMLSFVAASRRSVAPLTSISKRTYIAGENEERVEVTHLDPLRCLLDPDE